MAAGPVRFTYGDPAAASTAAFTNTFFGHLVVAKGADPPEWIPWQYTNYLEVTLTEGPYVWYMAGHFDMTRERVVDCPFPHNNLIVE